METEGQMSQVICVRVTARETSGTVREPTGPARLYKYSTNSPMIQVRIGVLAAKIQKSLFPPLLRGAEGVENPAADSAQLHKIGHGS